ncbi:hypothetical protein TNCV_1653311 [Trichonephila clavipes]|nr:hypothetical protein TNCV_1653311 [Trichonephila clavipes]
MDSHNKELTMDELVEMHEQELESLDPVQSEYRMTVGNSTRGLSVVEKGRGRVPHLANANWHLLSNKSARVPEHRRLFKFFLVPV